MATLASRYVRGRLRTLIWGPPGSAKTVNAHQMPRTRTLDLDDGMSSVMWAIMEGIIKKEPEEIVYETIVEAERNRNRFGLATKTSVLDRMTDTVDRWLDEEAMTDEEWAKELEARRESDPDDLGVYEDRFWDTLILDSTTAMTDASIVKAVDETGRIGLSKSKSLSEVIRVMQKQDWGAASSLFKQVIEMWKALDKNLIIIAHEYVEKDDDRIVAYKPAAIGQLRDSLAGMFDEVYYAYASGNKNDVKFNFQTKPGGKRQCKSRLGCLDAVIPADFNAIRAQVAEYYSLNESELWTRAQASDRPVAKPGNAKGK